MDKYGADIEWSVTGSGITGTDFDRNADTNKLILDIPTDFRGGTITITAKNKNGTETKSLPIEVQAFTSFDDTLFEISGPTTAVEIGKTCNLTYTAIGRNETLQPITWGFDKTGTPTSKQTVLVTTQSRLSPQWLMVNWLTTS